MDVWRAVITAAIVVLNPHASFVDNQLGRQDWFCVIVPTNLLSDLHATSVIL
jgi:hypothetical protein